MTQPPYVLDSPIQAAPLPQIRSHTQSPSQYLQMIDTDDQVFHVVVSRLTYDLDELDTQRRPRLAREQQALVESDQFYGEINASSLIQESDLAPYKPRCDVLFAHATAYAPEGKPAPRWPIGVRVGQWRKLLMVCGPRTLRRGALGYRLSDPTPVIQVPLRYERAFGGSCQWPLTLTDGAEPEIDTRHAANPIGCGFLPPEWLNKARPEVLRAPQLEVLEQPFEESHLRGQDYPVVGLGAIGRWWQPRLTLTGRFDQAWKEQRWPRLPQAFDFGYWNGAPADQQIDYPQGGEEIVLAGLTAGAGRMHLRLPEHPPHVLAHLHAGPVLPRPMHLDTLIFDLHRMTLSCVHRMLIAADADVRALEIRHQEA